MISAHFRWWNRTRLRTPWPCLLPTWSWAGCDYSFFQNITFDRDKETHSFHRDILFQTGLSDGRPAWLCSLQLWRTCQVRLRRFHCRKTSLDFLVVLCKIFEFFSEVILREFFLTFFLSYFCKIFEFSVRQRRQCGRGGCGLACLFQTWTIVSETIYQRHNGPKALSL